MRVTNIKFAAGKVHRLKIDQIASRYIKLCEDNKVDPPDRLDLEMTVSAVFAQGQVDLDLDRLIGFDDFNFAHDVSGMMRHIDRETGRLTRCFLPRAAR